MGISRTISDATFTLGDINVVDGTFVVKVAGTRTSKIISFIGDVIDTMSDIDTLRRVPGQESITFVVSDEVAHSEDPKSAIIAAFGTLMEALNEYVTRDPRLIESIDEQRVARDINYAQHGYGELRAAR